MDCPLCGERKAEPQYYRVNRVTERIEHLCRTCWLGLRKAERDEWEYYRGAGKLMLYYSVIPIVVTAALVWALAIVLL